MADKFYLKDHNGHKFSIVELPGSGFFQYEVATDIGADFEQAYQQKTGRWVFGMAHLIEHLSFKSPEDYTTDEFMEVLKAKGSYNAFTDTNRIHYYFNTTSRNWKLAVKLVANMAFNDLTKINADEFESEKSVVANEIRRYGDDKQTIFQFRAGAAAYGRNLDDNILGNADLLENFTLFDCIQMKGNFINHANMVHRISFDPDEVNIEEILTQVVEQSERIKSKNLPVVVNFTRTEVDSSYRTKMVSGPLQVASSSQQRMIQIIAEIPTCDFTTPQSLVVNYLGYTAHSSVNELIREKHGLTYGVSLHSEFRHGVTRLFFGVDVEPENEQLAIDLFKQAITETASNFTVANYDMIMEKFDISMVNSQLNRRNIVGYHDLPMNSPGWRSVSDVLAVDISKAKNKVISDTCSFSQLQQIMVGISNTIESNNYLLITSV